MKWSGLRTESIFCCSDMFAHTNTRGFSFERKTPHRWQIKFINGS